MTLLKGQESPSGLLRTHTFMHSAFDSGRHGPFFRLWGHRFPTPQPARGKMEAPPAKPRERSSRAFPHCAPALRSLAYTSVFRFPMRSGSGSYVNSLANERIGQTSRNLFLPLKWFAQKGCPETQEVRQHKHAERKEERKAYVHIYIYIYPQFPAKGRLGPRISIPLWEKWTRSEARARRTKTP